MKTRTSFVANSSSSSFIIVYKEVPTETIDSIFDTEKIPDDLKGQIKGVGKYLSDGYDMFTLTEDIVKIINDSSVEIRRYSLPDKYFIPVMVERDTIDIRPEYVGFKIMSVEVDFYSTATTQEFKDRYIV